MDAAFLGSVACGALRGLAFLHGLSPPVIHRGATRDEALGVMGSNFTARGSDATSIFIN